ncbi:MAG: tetratricopeptide repeat protein [Methylophilaceae bacterium]|nr:tetratricopeptide repeat protein [Methylophilaceae bacterium]
MAYDLEEQEQLDEIKAWWKRYGNWALTAVTVVAVSIAAIQGWKSYQYKQSAQASVIFQELIQANDQDVKNIQTKSAQLIENYASTAYAGRAALLAAKVNYQAKDVKSAKAQLEWASKNAKESAVVAMALLQLAGIQFEEKNYDAALKTLDEKRAAGFAGLFADLKGDVLIAQGKKAEAKIAYELALKTLDAEGSYAQYTKYKLEALGDDA